jgi:serine/threonine protein kinase
MRQGPQLKAGEFLWEGRLKLLEPLGSGGFATIWKGLDRKRHELVAIKVLHGQHVEDRSHREQGVRLRFGLQSIQQTRKGVSYTRQVCVFILFPFQ